MKNTKNKIFHFQYKSFYSGIVIGFLAMILFLKKNKKTDLGKTMTEESLKNTKVGIEDDPLNSSSTHTGG